MVDEWKSRADGGFVGLADDLQVTSAKAGLRELARPETGRSAVDHKCLKPHIYICSRAVVREVEKWRDQPELLLGRRDNIEH